MKANGAKRKIFNDAIDLLDQMGEAAAVLGECGSDAAGREDPPFCGHPFRMYEGERLERLPQSIREHGVLNPVIVRNRKTGTHRSGYNRAEGGDAGGD